MKQFGLIVSDPSQDSALRQSISSLLSAQEIPFFGFTDASAPLFADCPDTRAAFLFRAAYALMQPGQPLPADLLLRHLSGDAQPGKRHPQIHLPAIIVPAVPAPRPRDCAAGRRRSHRG